ncbi:MAG: MarR family winged helix-turn-helix transcriptional regulator [Vampirovibrionia bacterium]
MQGLSRFGINMEEFGIESSAFYSVITLFLLLEKQIVEYLKPYNLSPSQFNALMIIKHMGKSKGLSQVDISEKLIVSASNMTRLLDKLKKESLIERCPQEHDRRVNLIKVTDKGSALLDEIWPAYIELIKKLTRHMDENELKSTTGLLLKWFSGIEHI